MTTLLYSDEWVQLYHGDYRDVLQLDSNWSFDAVVTDPPYGRATKFKWDVWPKGWVDDMEAITNALWCFGSLQTMWTHHADFARWKLSQEIVWEKHNGSSFHTDRFRRVHELAVMFFRGRWDGLYHVTPTTADATKRAIRQKRKPAHHQGEAGPRNYRSEDGGPRLMRSVIQARSENGRAIHKTQKALAAVQPLIEYSVPPGGLVFDPFGGSATTAVAARLSGRRAVVCEVDLKHAEAAARRLSQQIFEQPTEGKSA